MRVTDLAKSLGRPVAIGMLHVPALPGSAGYGGDLAAIKARVLLDAGKLVRAGVDGLMLENFGDVPFFPGRVGHETASYLAMLGCAVKAAHAKVTLGINVLRNDGVTAIGVAHACGADFVRVNVLCGARVTDQGILQANAHDVLRLRKNLGAEAIEILADVDVKHSSPLGVGRPIEIEVEDLVSRAMADGLIVSGTGTGKATDASKVAVVQAAARKLERRVPALVGSGVTEASVEELGSVCDGFIVGTSLKEEGTGPGGPVDEAKAARFMRVVRELKR